MVMHGPLSVRLLLMVALGAAAYLATGILTRARPLEVIMDVIAHVFPPARRIRPWLRLDSQGPADGTEHRPTAVGAE
jgi:hypothetical protein